MFNKDTWGRLLTFIFVWQFIISGPMEIASGFLAISSYLTYVVDMNQIEQNLVACGFCLIGILLIYFGVEDVEIVSVILWGGSFLAILFTIIWGAQHFHTDDFKVDDSVWDDKQSLIWAFGVAMRFGVYDFMGYYDINYIAEELKTPRKTIPFANVWTMIFCSFIFVAVDISIFCVVPWESITEDPDNANIMSL
eukprot:UN31830